MVVGGQGDFPFSSVWPTTPGLTKEQRFGNSDQSLSKFLDNFFFDNPTFNANIDLFVHGKTTNTNLLNLFTKNSIPFSGSLDLFIPTKDNKNQELDLFIYHSVEQTKNLDLTIIGHESFNSNLDLFIYGRNIINNNLTMFISTVSVFSKTADLFIHGVDTFSDSINLFISGPVPNTVNLDATQVVVSSGLQDITIPDFGIVKAVILIVGNPTATGIQESGIQYSIGFTDGIKSRSIGFSSEDNTPNSNTYSIWSEDHIAMLIDKSTGDIDNSIQFNDWIQDGIRINSDIAPSGNYLLTAIFLGGAALDVLVDTFVTPSTTGNSIDVNTVFSPDQLIGISNGFAFNEIVQGLGRLCVGFADNGNVLNQGSASYFSADNATIGSPASIISSGIFARRTSLSSSLNSVQISGFTSSGFIAETVTSNGSTSVGFLALKYNDGRKHFVGFVDSPTTSGLYEFTNPGFRPLIVMQLLTQLESLDTLVSFNKAGAHGLSVFTKDKEFCHSFSEQSSTIMTNNTLFDNQAVNFPNHSGLISFVANLDSMTPDGWKPDFTSVDGVAKKWLALAIEDIGIVFSSKQFDLFISGQGETKFWNIFLKTPENDIATSRNLFIHGSPSGVDLNFVGQGIDLFIKSSIEDSIYPPITSKYGSLFIRVESGNESTGGYRSLFLASDTSIDNNIDLYISTNEKIASGFIDLFIARIPDFPGEDGFTPVSNYQTLFLKTIVGETDILDLFVSGVFATNNNNIDCFIEGCYTINDTLNLMLYGISGISNDNIDLYIYGIDMPIEKITLFVRGY